MPNIEEKGSLFSAIRDVITQAWQQAYRGSNAILLRTHWKISRLIVEDEQGGNAKAVYGKAVLKHLSQELTREFDTGLDESNLRNIRNFTWRFQCVTRCLTHCIEHLTASYSKKSVINTGCSLSATTAAAGGPA